MNRVWPGDPEGSLTERMAHLIWTELVSHADEVVDLHTAGRNNPVWVFYEADGVSELAPSETALRSEEMAHLFGAPIMYVEAEAYGGRATLRASCVDNGIPAIVPELGGFRSLRRGDSDDRVQRRQEHYVEPWDNRGGRGDARDTGQA